MSDLYKYPRTGHVFWSEGRGSDDKIQYDLSNFEGKEVVMSEKRDGENTSLYTDYYHARSLDSENHPSQTYVKGLWGQISYNIPLNWRVCGENLYALHSLGYDDLKSYFECFNIWNEKNRCLDIDSTLEWCELLDIVHVPIIYRGIFDLDFIKNYKIDEAKQEGWVLRLAEEFAYEDFTKSVIKWVRKNHVQTDVHWKNKKVIPNKLKQ